MLEVLRQRLRRDDRVIHPLAALLVLLGPRRGFPFKDGAVAPVVVGLVHVIQRVRFFGIGSFLVEGNDLGQILQHRVGLKRLPDELGQFQSSRLEDFQALAHLWRKRLLLGKRLVERDV